MDLINAMALGCSDPILTTVIPDGLKTPLGIVLNLIQDICNSGLEVCNIMGSVQVRETNVAIGAHCRPPPLGLVA